VLSLAVSAFYCGVSGALMGGYMSFIQPAMFDMAKSTELVSIVVFGGVGTMSGWLLGTTILTLVTELFRPISQYRMLIYGLVLVLVMVLRPEGIMGTSELTPKNAARMWARFRVFLRDTITKLAISGIVIGLPVSYCFQAASVREMPLGEYLTYVPGLVANTLVSGSSQSSATVMPVFIACLICAFVMGTSGYIIKQLRKNAVAHAHHQEM
jgi:branched-subunit amino acid ABC-type transport system permease component